MGIHNSEGVWQEDQGRIEGIILDYFNAIFKSDHSTNFEASLSAFNKRVTTKMNEELLTDFKVDKVWRALKQMHPTKALGPDNMSIIFYENYWDIVGSDVIKCVLNALNSGVMPSDLNETFIYIIPKVKSPQKIIEFRSISLCNVIYKIISKVLANRLKESLQ